MIFICDIWVKYDALEFEYKTREMLLTPITVRTSIIVPIVKPIIKTIFLTMNNFIYLVLKYLNLPV